MNCAQLFAHHAKSAPTKMAIVTANEDGLSFADLALLTGGIQEQLQTLGLKTNDRALVMATPCGGLYACALALMGLGISIVFVEPWMPLSSVKQVIKLNNPKIFVANLLGFAWGARIKEIRSIPHWVTLSTLVTRAKKRNFLVLDVDPDLPGIITFTTGTTGAPKGVVRSQGYLVNQHEVLTKSLGLASGQNCDLTIFANFVFSNLARGATSLLMPSRWSKKNFRLIDAKANIYKPSTTTCGPAFLLNAMRYSEFSTLDHIHVGGALTDCKIFETAFDKWPKASFLHVYGSSEAEPVASVDARISVKESKHAGYFQALFLGQPVEEAMLTFTKDTVWVSGRHVCPLYVGSEKENQLYKKLDQHGVLWHDMGDRVAMNDLGLWYQGRSSQEKVDFLLEQQLYFDLKTSKSFIRRNGENEVIWLGEDFLRMKQVATRYKQISRVVKTNIVRDRRHRARIDRVQSLPRHMA